MAWVWMLAALPLPLLVMRLLPRAETAAAALRVPFYSELAGLDQTGAAGRAGSWRALVAAAAWVLLVAAACRPQWISPPEGVPVTGRDLLLAVDVSESMRLEDMELRGRRYSRLSIVKYLASEFIGRREGDRIGLILFGTQPYLQTPMTFDRDAVATLLAEAELGIAGKQTAIGDAIGLAVKRLRDSDNPEKVLILLTDGANTAGEVAPRQAAEFAQAAGLRIYAIGVGADEQMVRGLFGTRRINPSADLDEATLQAITDTTGGRYFRARDSESLAEIYRILDRLEPAAETEQSLRSVSELFVWPLALALGLAGLLAVLPLAADARRPGSLPEEVGA